VLAVYLVCCSSRQVALQTGLDGLPAQSGGINGMPARAASHAPSTRRLFVQHQLPGLLVSLAIHTNRQFLLVCGWRHSRTLLRGRFFLFLFTRLLGRLARQPVTMRRSGNQWRSISGLTQGWKVRSSEQVAISCSWSGWQQGRSGWPRWPTTMAGWRPAVVASLTGAR